MFTYPSPADFQAYFFRDFQYTADAQDLKSVQVRDIQAAMNIATPSINQALWTDQNTFNVAFLLLTAHYLSINLRNASQGIGSGFDWLYSNKAAGPVNEGFVIPERVQNSPQLAQLCKTGYGGMYLTMLLPRITGVMFTVLGRTKP